MAAEGAENKTISLRVGAAFVGVIAVFAPDEARGLTRSFVHGLA